VISAAAGAGFALAVRPISAATISTPADGLDASDVTIKTSTGDIPGYRAVPAKRKKKAPVVLVVHEIFGVHEHIRDVCRRLAKQGYFAVAPELFFRQGDVSKIADFKEIRSKVVSKVPDAQVMSDLDATVAWAKGTGRADTAALGITGFCWGGRITLKYAAHNPQVAAAVAWYGPVARSYHAGDAHAADVVGSIKAPVLGLFGAEDPGIPNETVEAFFAALKAAGNHASELVLYPATPHAFHADYRPSYRKREAEDGWQRALAWFERYLK
jgi:carboxymethylenebutenolidase